MNNRAQWLDQAKGYALIISIYFIFNKWLLIDFKSWSIGGNFSSFNTELIQGIETFGRMALIFLTALSFEFVGQKDLLWFGRKMIKYLLLPTLLLIHGYEYIGLHWEFFQSLGIYFVLFYFLKNYTSSWTKYLVSICLMGVYVASLPLWQGLSQSFLGSLLFGYFPENNLFNIASGLPMVVVSSLLAPYLVQDKKLNKKILYLVSVVSFLCFALVAIAYKTSFFGGKNFNYPPHILEYASGLSIGLGLILLSLFPNKAVSIFGRHGFVVYWISWWLSFIIIDWNQLGLYSFSLGVSFLIFLTYLTIAFITTLYLEKRYESK